ncbi:uncharacterized protein PRCAT00003261001 [Priceomyces carsonii]|uniref:uncharacterized protein n=1 Tax=Priceomyces carsonii TaxID=28549 RepID=UPI002EDA9589|nr:unnamed protein product [Priceomyces carsonii]
MGWFSSSKTTAAPDLSTQQIEQRSHNPLNTNSDISQTLHQIGDNGEPKVQMVNDNFTEKLQEFVQAKPKNMFIIDGEKDTKDSIICTNNETGGKTCLKLGMSSIELFKTMQKMDYFCSLPDDIDSTYFECRKIS